MCSSIETALFYLPGPAPNTSYVGNIVIRAGMPLRFNLPVQLTRHPTECKWQESVLGPFSFEEPSDPEVLWSLEIVAEDEAYIYVYYGDDTYVYKPSSEFENPACQVLERDFDPLCTNIFELDLEESDFPAVLIPRCLCLSYANGCCDSPNIRSEPMPRTLYAQLRYCCGLESPLTVDFELEWNPLLGWYGETPEPVCGAVLQMYVYCVCGMESGCGSHESTLCYRANITHASCPVAETVFQTDSCDCEPLELSFRYGATSCCAAEATIDWVITVIE